MSKSYKGRRGEGYIARGLEQEAEIVKTAIDRAKFESGQERLRADFALKKKMKRKRSNGGCANPPRRWCCQTR